MWCRANPGLPRYWRTGNAAAHYYERLRLWDGKAGAEQNDGRSFWSQTWLNVPTHSATLAVDISWPAQPAAQFWGYPLRGACIPQDHSRLDDALSAIVAAKLPHETLLIDFEPAFERRFYGAL